MIDTEALEELLAVAALLLEELLTVALELVLAFVLELLEALELEPLQPVNASAGRAITRARARANVPFFILFEDFIVPLIS